VEVIIKQNGAMGEVRTEVVTTIRLWVDGRRIASLRSQ